MSNRPAVRWLKVQPKFYVGEWSGPFTALLIIVEEEKRRWCWTAAVESPHESPLTMRHGVCASFPEAKREAETMFVSLRDCLFQARRAGVLRDVGR